MKTVGLRELRQNASELVRRAEEGEEITITVAGRPGARLVPADPRAGRQWGSVAEVFNGPADPDWDTDRQMVDHQVRSTGNWRSVQSLWRSYILECWCMVDLYKRVIDCITDIAFPLSIHFEATYGVSTPTFETLAEILDYWSPDSR